MKKITLIILATLTVTGIMAQNPKKYLKAGDTFMKSGNYSDAIEQYRHAIELNPTNIAGYLKCGEALESLNRFEEAYDNYDKARAFEPKNIDVLYSLGRTCNNLERFDEAISILNYASSIAKRESRLYPEKVRTLIGLGQYDQALKVSDTAMLFKEDELNYYQRGLAFEKLNNYIRARKDYEKAVQKNKKYIPARLALAEMLIKQNELDAAMEQCDYLIGVDDKNTDAYIVRSKIYVAMMNFPAAINDVSRNIMLDPGNPENYAIRGDYYQQFNQHTNAINDYTKAISLNDSVPDLYFKRAKSYEEIMKFEDAADDYAKITVLSEFDMQARKLLKEANDRLYEINRESDPPEVTIENPVIVDKMVQVRGDADRVIISGKINEVSNLKSLFINGASTLFEKGSDGKYDFLSNLDIRDADEVSLVAIDDYDNRTDLSFKINRTEVSPPTVTIIAPYASDDGQIYLDSNDPEMFIEGRITDESKIKSLFIEGVTASYALNELNPNFTARVNVFNKNKITVMAEDIYGNRQISEFRLNREGAAINEDNPMGKTWIVFVENSNYESFASLDGPVKDINLMQRALTNYEVHNVIHKKDLTKDEMEKFFSIELRDMVKSNQVKSLLIWYAGHGKFVNETGYWIPVDAKRDDEFTYYNINTLRASMEPYANLLTHTLVVTDACESGPSFYTAMRSAPEAKSCDDWQATQFKSSQVFSSAGYELAVDDSQFTRTFATALSSNPNACIPIEEIVSKVTMAVTNNNQQKPKFGKIAGLRDENGTFFFIAK